MALALAQMRERVTFNTMAVIRSAQSLLLGTYKSIRRSLPFVDVNLAVDSLSVLFIVLGASFSCYIRHTRPRPGSAYHIARQYFQVPWRSVALGVDDVAVGVFFGKMAGDNIHGQNAMRTWRA